MTDVFDAFSNQGILAVTSLLTCVFAALAGLMIAALRPTAAINRFAVVWVLAATALATLRSFIANFFDLGREWWGTAIWVHLTIAMATLLRYAWAAGIADRADHGRTTKALISMLDPRDPGESP